MYLLSLDQLVAIDIISYRQNLTFYGVLNILRAKVHNETAGG